MDEPFIGIFAGPYPQEIILKIAAIADQDEFNKINNFIDFLDRNKFRDKFDSDDEKYSEFVSFTRKLYKLGKLYSGIPELIDEEIGIIDENIDNLLLERRVEAVAQNMPFNKFADAEADEAVGGMNASENFSIGVEKRIQQLNDMINEYISNNANKTFIFNTVPLQPSDIPTVLLEHYNSVSAGQNQNSGPEPQGGGSRKRKYNKKSSKSKRRLNKSRSKRRRN